MASGIRFFSEETDFSLKQKGKIRTWLSSVVQREQNLSCDLNIIFCSDLYLLELNKKFLDHHFYTDILTFPGPEDQQTVSGEIFISVERVKENAENFNQSFDREMARVMVHGVLHLLGYKDKTLKERRLMTEKENQSLKDLFDL